MSDTEDGPDDFDKEAEREKLREQYERDRKRREATQQMSELLLKGATMTNQHCEECGSPIFRYEGEAFCPTCAGTRGVEEGEAPGATEGETPADAGSGASADAESGAPADAAEGQRRDDGQPAGADRGTPQGDADRSAGQSPSPDVADLAGDDQPGAGAPSGRQSPALSGDASSGESGGGADDAGDESDDLEAMRSRLDERAASRSPAAGGSPERRTDPPRSSGSPVRSGEVPSMAQSRASLRRAIVSLSEQAAQSDDPGRAHNLLKGAREAAEALAALEGTTGE